MKLRNWPWLLISVGLIGFLAAPVLGQAATIEPTSDQIMPVTNRLIDSSNENVPSPRVLTWELTVNVATSSDYTGDPGYVIATADGEGKRTTGVSTSPGYYGQLKETYAEGTIVKLEARANTRWEFDNWSGQIPNEYGVVESSISESEENPIYVRMYQDIEINAWFWPLIELVVDSTEGGSVSPFEGSEWFQAETGWGGDIVTLTAEPEPGFMFFLACRFLSDGQKGIIG